MLNDLEFMKIPKNTKLQLVDNNLKPKKTLKGVMSANITDLSINSSPTLSFSLANKIESSILFGLKQVENDMISRLKNEMIIKVLWNDNKQTNYFVIKEIKSKETANEESETLYMCEGLLLSELKRVNVALKQDGISLKEATDAIFKDSRWKIGTISSDFNNIYRSFDIEKQTIYETLIDIVETFGAILDVDEKNRIINITTLNNVKKNRNVIIKKENLLTEIERNTQTNEIVTRLHIVGNKDMTIQKVNPTGMTYIEDFSYFMYPFKRDKEKNVLQHSNYMSDMLCHGLLDMSEKAEELHDEIMALKSNIETLLDDLLNKQFDLTEKDGERIRIEALLDTAKATNDQDLIYQNNQKLLKLNDEIEQLKNNIKTHNEELEKHNKQLHEYEKQIKTSYMSDELQDELKSFIYEKTFKNDLYINEKELFEAGKKELRKYRDGIVSFDLTLDSFINSLDMQRYNNRLQLCEIVTIKSEELNEVYQTIVVGYTSVDLITGDLSIHFSDNIQKDFALDRLATLIYNAQTSTSILEGNKHRWDNVVKLENEVNQMRDADFDAVNKRVIAGANESVTMDNRGLQIINPDFPNERIIMQSGVMALSKDGGETWSTSVTPNGVIADTLIGKLIAGNDLIISNESGTLKINQDGMKVDMDSIEIINGTEGSAENILELWNSLLIDFEDLQNLNKVNSYEKKKLNEEWKQIKIIHSSLLDQYSKGHDKEEPHTLEYNQYIEVYENLNKFLNKQLQSDGFTILDQDRLDVTSNVDGHILSTLFQNYVAKKSALENTIQIDVTRAELKILENGIFAKFVQKDEIVAQLNLTKDGVKIDGRLLSIDSKTEFNDDVKMNAGIIMSKDEKIQIDLNSGNILLNKPIHIGNNSNLSTKSDVNNQINQAQENFDEKINTVKNEFGQNLVTLENDLGEKVTLVKDEFGKTIKVIEGGLNDKISDAQQEFDAKISETKTDLGHTISVMENDFGKRVTVVKNELGQTINVLQGDLTKKITDAESTLGGKIESVESGLDSKINKDEIDDYTSRAVSESTKDIYDNLEFLREKQNQAQFDLSSKVAIDELNELDKRYQEYYGATANEINETRTRLQEQADVVAGITTDLHDLSQEWRFTNKFIQFSDYGIVIGEKNSNTQLTVENDKISMTSNGYEVMHITGGEIKISRGVFIETLKIGKYIERIYREDDGDDSGDINVIEYLP